MWTLSLVALLMLPFGFGVWYVLTVIQRAERRKPKVICVCELNGLVSVCWRRDYDAASQAHWSWYQRGGWYDHRRVLDEGPLRLIVSPTFVFEARSPEYQRILLQSYVERTVIDVPAIPFESNAQALRHALKYLYGAEIVS